jgi:hypothetical protein
MWPGLWDVFLLFLIPVGGGIPAGVILAQKQGLPWILTAFLYFVSDVVLACLFEPFLNFVIRSSRRSARSAKFASAMKKAFKKTTPYYGNKLSPLALIGVSFGVDPMTGRTVARAAGHGFLTGWTLAIAGDMLYFAMIMASTLWLNNILGDGTWTTIIITVLMLFGPVMVKKIRDRWSGPSAGGATRGGQSA